MSDPAKGTVGQRLGAALERAGIGRNELARRLHVAKSTVSKWVAGVSEPSYATLAEICRMTGTSADEILGIKDLKLPVPPAAPKAFQKLFREAERATARLEAATRDARVLIARATEKPGRKE